MEEEATGWEGLDIDDSDFPSLLRPCKRRHHSTAATTTSSVTLIPGPAGSIQAAMNRKLEQQQPLSTQDYLSKALDDDFSLPPWLCAIDFLRHQGFVDGRGLLLTMPLSLIAGDSTIQRVPMVVGIVKSCTSNGLGDMMVTLKDPTGAVGASIHRTVLADVDFGKDISAGAVLLLKQVAVFSPSRNANYLNITPSNVVKVISKICGPGNDLALTFNHTTCAAESQETVVSGLRGGTQDIMNGLRKDMNGVREGQTAAVTSGFNKEEEVVGGSGSGSQSRAQVCKKKASIPQWTDQQLEELFTFE